jgi:hypothetical protein
MCHKFGVNFVIGHASTHIKKYFILGHISDFFKIKMINNSSSTLTTMMKGTTAKTHGCKALIHITQLSTW